MRPMQADTYIPATTARADGVGTGQQRSKRLLGGRVREPEDARGRHGIECPRLIPSGFQASPEKTTLEQVTVAEFEDGFMEVLID
eukprot:3987827-Pyramimonas_sp.AAC.1